MMTTFSEDRRTIQDESGLAAFAALAACMACCSIRASCVTNWATIGQRRPRTSAGWRGAIR